MNSDRIEDLISQVSIEKGIPKSQVREVYNSVFRFIHSTTSKILHEVDLDNLTKESFKSIKTSFNISNIGKLHIKYSRLEKIKNRKQKQELENGI